MTGRTEIKDLEEKEEINIQPEQHGETRIQKNEESLRISGTTLNVQISELQGCQKEMSKSKKLKTYLNK